MKKQDDFLLRQLQSLQLPVRRPLVSSNLPAAYASNRLSLPPKLSNESIRREIVRRAIRGEKFGEIAATLNKQGMRAKHGGRWYCSSVRACWLSLATVKEIEERAAARQRHTY